MMRDKSRKLACTITDVSAVGFQISVDQPLSQGEFVQVLVDGKSVISVIRSCTGAGSNFVLGLERVDQWASGEGWSASALAGRAKSLKNPVGDLRSAAMQDLFEYREFMGRRIRPRTFSLMLSASALLAMLSVGVAVMPKYRSQTHGLQIHLSEASWVSGCADGKKVFEAMFPAGADAELHYASKAVIESKNASAVAVTIGEKRVDALGEHGSTRSLRVTADSFQIVEASSPGSCAAN
jgi:hypothetical protein